MKEIILKSNRLEVCVNICEPGEIETTRFDRACRVSSILLDQKYSFAQREQLIETRQSSNGYGLSSEWVVENLGTDTKAGEYFYKPGVGMLRQKEDFLPYNIFGKYECLPSKTDYSVSENAVTFIENSDCGVQIKRTLQVVDHQIEIETTVANTGDAPIHMSEYQHNFFAIDNRPVDVGYHLYIPYIKDLTAVEWESSGLDEIGAACGPVPMPLQLSANTISWNRAMNNNAYYVSFPQEHILDDANYKWQLSHDNCHLKVSEYMNFKPSRQDIWGIEHCICAEGFKSIHLIPGESDCYKHIWTFEA